MRKKVIKNAFIVNEGKIIPGDVLINGERIEKIASHISITNEDVIEAAGTYLLPGFIDDQVHFRDPGLTHKADIYTESRAAIAGGITSYMDMPNTVPNTLTQTLLEEKYALAAKKSLANYSFFMGINRDNLEEALKTNHEDICGITDDGLYFSGEGNILANQPDYLEKLFSRVETLVALHSEDESIIHQNFLKYQDKYGENIPFSCHHLIRSEEACLTATQRVLDIARKYQNRLHFFHISTLAEAQLFDNKTPVSEKRITAEACIHHLYFSDEDYEKYGAYIKWNPAIKTKNDKDGLLNALINNKLDIIATDHAPHTIQEKNQKYKQAMSGGPLVQHALPALLELFHERKIGLEKIVEKTSHHVAEIYRIQERGYIREGYFADLVLIDLESPWKVSTDNILYKCSWSPFLNQTFKSKIAKTFVNGHLAYDNGFFSEEIHGKRLKFSKIR